MTGKLAAALLVLAAVAAPPAARAQSSSPAQTQRYNVYFERGMSRLTVEAAAVLDEIVNQIRKRPDASIAIVGHYDTSLPAAKALSQSRANANNVAAFLKIHAIDPKRIQVTAVGSNDLARPTGPGIAEPLNRYVEINVGATEQAVARPKKTNAQADAEYAEKMQAWNREMQARDERVREYQQAQDAVARQKAEQAARARAAQQQYDQARADWERRSAACRAGDYSQCSP